jgi:hypothetical protein
MLSNICLSEDVVVTRENSVVEEFGGLMNSVVFNDLLCCRRIKSKMEMITPTGGQGSVVLFGG